MTNNKFQKKSPVSRGVQKKTSVFSINKFQKKSPVSRGVQKKTSVFSINKFQKKSPVSRQVQKKTSVFSIKKWNKLMFSEPQTTCFLRIHIKKNNFFVNVTNTQGQTLARFSTGIYETKKNAKAKKNMPKYVKLILFRACTFIKSNFKTARIFIKTTSPKVNYYVKVLFFYLKPFANTIHHFLENGIVSLHINIPTPHNGCRPPKKRRI